MNALSQGAGRSRAGRTFRFRSAVGIGSLALVVAAAAAPAAEPRLGPGPAAQRASHVEVKPLDVPFERLSSLRLGSDGNLLACDAGAGRIKVISPAGRLLRTIQPGFAPEALDVAADGTIYCGGEGKLAVLDARGTVRATVEAPQSAEGPVTETSRRRAEACNVALRLRVSGIAASPRDVFVAFGSGWSTVSTSKLFRFDRRLENPKLLAEGVRGCCQRCDIVFRDGVLYLAENSAHRVVLFDRDGNVLGKWGRRTRDGLEGFGACCNPMNLCFDASGTLYTAESGLGRVKRYATDGKLLGLVGYVGVQRFTRAGPQAAACSNIALAATPDGQRIYVMDYKNNVIRVLTKKDGAR